MHSRFFALTRWLVPVFALFAVLLVFVPADAASSDMLARSIRLRNGTIIPLPTYASHMMRGHPPSQEAAPHGSVNVGARNLPGLQMNLPSKPESVIGPDGRKLVASPAAYPFSAIAQLEVDFPTGSYTCTGWMIGPHTLMTAGHCVYFTETGGYANAITVYPGRSGTTAPFGAFKATDWYTTLGWYNTEDPIFDYAIVQLGTNIDSQVGTFGFAFNKKNAFFNNMKIKVTGYPGDKPYGTMWTMKGPIDSVIKTRLFYPIDTYGGQSGSPAYGKWNDCNPCAFGVHTYGVGGGWNDNSATRIVPTVYAFMCYARGGGC